MEPYKIKLLQTIVVIAVLLLVKLLLSKSIYKISTRFDFALRRVNITFRIINIILISFGTITLAAIWGLDQKELLLFISSTITVLGVAFFAQWSILSNVTSGLVLFFSHPLRIGDNIRIFDKDFEVEGRLQDISVFFMHIETKDGKNITMPNTLALQKIISIIPDEVILPVTHEEQRVHS
ncbi:mechanosensitive ion channel [Pontibacter qinzhouensis]|uniref:Mechanosensitive ion channel n=1 Tax=Pontibacter qinzhouensis TaxID=2603253 RepID=A0A5C8JK05_9BACT|nr:mechanosensitive ion channel domain-containing protein [Pontibacter qinzhouensis]TXK37004.1 mechanosensitive ion channel [Pontibacter qinzhouensis]